MLDPIAMLLLPVVRFDQARYPRAVLSEPVVFPPREEAQSATLLAPVVFE